MESFLRNLPQPTTRENNHGFTREIIVIYSAIFAALIVLIGVFAEYEELMFFIEGGGSTNKAADAAAAAGTTLQGEKGAPLVSGAMGIRDSGRFTFFQSVHVFVYIGFGFLTSFLCHGMLSATGHTMIVASLASFFAILARGFFGAFNFGEAVTPLTLNIRSIIEADFAAAAVLISFGAVLGRLTVPQLLAMAFCEVIFYAFTEARLNGMGAADAGGALAIHTFGAIFGIAVSAIGCFDRERSDRYNKPSDISNAMSMVGSLFLFVYFPSFNASSSNSEMSMTRAVVNTYLAISCSTISTFFLEMFNHNKITGWQLQRATLAGGIAISSAANMTFSPFRASVAGVLAALAVHFGEKFLTPYLAKLGVTDTCGIHLFHGMPGLLGAVLALFGSLYASVGNYDNSTLELRAVFPKMGYVPAGASDDDSGLVVQRTAGGQAVAQLAAIVVTIVIAAVGGAITGLLIRYLPDPEVHYHDADTYEGVQHVPDTTPSPELKRKIEKRRRRFALKNKMTELQDKCREAFERKDGAASRAAHRQEFELVKAQLQADKDKEKKQDEDEKEAKKEVKRLKKEQKKQEKTTQAETGSQHKDSDVEGASGSDSDSSSSSSSSGSSGSDSGSGSDSDEDYLVHPEPHAASGGDTLKTVVFGALDGIMTTFAVVTAAAGGGQGWKLVVAYGFAHLLADAFSMGFGEFIGSKAELDNAIAERKREAWENEHNPEGEIREMVHIYKNRGFSQEDAEALVAIHAKDHERFVDFMMKEELEIDVDVDDEWGPVQGSLVMFFSFVSFGALPMLPYLSQTGRGVDTVFITSCVLVGFGLLGLGALKGALTGLPVARTALSMLASGILSGGISYYVGVVVAGKVLSGVDGADSIGGSL